MRQTLFFRFAPLLIALFLSGTSAIRATDFPAFQAGWEAPRDPVYVGERFHLTLEVVSREGSLAKNIRLDGLPSTNHLYCESFADLPVEIRGIGNQISEIRRFRTIATLLQPGPCEIHVTLYGTQIRKTQNYFFTQREERPVSLSTTPITLNAIPLPQINRPPSFQGTIGTGFALSARIAPTSVVVGDLITATIRIQTDNPLSTPALITTPDLPNFKSYPLKIEPVTDAPMIRSFSQIIIPLSDQARAWGPITFAYFDPRQHAYILLKQGPFDLTFLPDRPTPVADYRPFPTLGSNSATTASILALRTGRYPGFKAFSELYNEGKFTEALDLPFSSSNTDSQSLADELHNRGCAWLALGMGEKAAAAFRAGLYRDPRAADLREGFRQAALTLATPPPPSATIHTSGIKPRSGNGPLCLGWDWDFWVSGLGSGDYRADGCTLASASISSRSSVCRLPSEASATEKI